MSAKCINVNVMISGGGVVASDPTVAKTYQNFTPQRGCQGKMLLGNRARIIIINNNNNNIT